MAKINVKDNEIAVITLDNKPTPNIKGIVPKQNKNIDNAPYINDPVDNAYICIA